MKIKRLLATAASLFLIASASLASAWTLPSSISTLENSERFAASRTGQDACVTYTTKRGTVCNDPYSLEYTITNGCSSGASVTVWHKRTANGEWIEGSKYYINPGNSISGWWCKGPIPYDVRITYRLR